jgi:hypothetical protein
MSQAELNNSGLSENFKEEYIQGFNEDFSQFHAAVSDFQENLTDQTEGFTRQTTENLEEDFTEQAEEDFTEQAEEDFTEQAEEDFTEQVEEDFTEQVEEDFTEQVEEDFTEQVEEDFTEQVESVEENFSEQVEEDFAPNTCATCNNNVTENFSEAESEDFLDAETAESLESMEQEVSSEDFTESFAEKSVLTPSSFFTRHMYKIFGIVGAVIVLILAMVYLGGSGSKGSSDDDFGGEFSEF